MATEGPRHSGTQADDSTVGTVSWSNPANAASSNNIYADAFVSGSDLSHYLKLTNFGFSIPSGATINGITVTFERSCSIGAVKDNAVRIVKGGVISSVNLSAAAVWNSTDQSDTFGDATQLWGETWTDSDINASNFGVVLAVNSNAGAPSQAKVDDCTITITYTPATVSGTASVTFSVSALDAVGKFGPSGAAAVTFDVSAIAASGHYGYTGTVTETFDVSAISAQSNVSGTAAVTLDVSSLDGAGHFGYTGSGSETFGVSTFAAAGAQLYSGNLSESLPVSAPTASGHFGYTGSGSVSGSSAFSGEGIYAYTTDLELGEPLQVKLTLYVPDAALVDTELAMDSPLVLHLKSYIHYTGMIDPSAARTKFMEVQRSGVSQILFGSQANPFKLNIAGLAHRRSSAIHILHLADTVKPELCEVEGEFQIVAPMGNLLAGEFFFETREGYLRIRNEEAIATILTLDPADTYEIDTTAFLNVAVGTIFTTVVEPKTEL